MLNSGYMLTLVIYYIFICARNKNTIKPPVGRFLFYNSISSYFVVPNPIDSAYGNMCRPICRSMRSCGRKIRNKNRR